MKTIRLTILLLTVVAFAWPVRASDEVTVGSFIQRLAQSKNLNSADARIAVDALGEIGIRLPPELELSAKLTEGDVARVSRALGLAVSTNRPDAAFSGEQVDRFFASFRVELAVAADASAGTGPRATGGGRSTPTQRGRVAPRARRGVTISRRPNPNEAGSLCFRDGCGPK